MSETWLLQLEAWHEFYLLIGSAGLTLTGLLFVVVSLAPRVVAEQHASGVRAFASPNAVYFTTALVASAVALFPGMSAKGLGGIFCLGSIAMLGYLAHAKIHQQWRENQYSLLDWLWYVGLPFAAYMLLLASGIGLLFQATLSMQGAGVAFILLLVIGIRNAWDIIIWVIQRERNNGT